MPVTEKEAIEYIGLDLSGFEDAEAFKTAYDAEWLKRSEVHKDEGVKKQVMGKLFGVITSNAKRLLGTYGEEVTEDELKELKIEALLDKVKGAADSHYGKKVKDLETSLEGAKGDKTTKELEKQLAEAIKHRDEYKTQSEERRVMLENKDKEFVQTQRNAKEKELWDEAMASAPFKKDMDPLTRKGFEAIAREKVKTMWDEEGNPYTADANGNRIKDTSKSNSFLDHKQAIAALVIENKLNETNPHAGKPVGTTSKPSATPPVETPPGQKMRAVHPAAMAG